MTTKPGCCPERNSCGDREETVAATGRVRTLTTSWTWRDRLGTWGVRWGFRRMAYRVQPGLYRIGEPDANAPVLVTANYKLTLDIDRKSVV